MNGPGKIMKCKKTFLRFENEFDYISEMNANLHNHFCLFIINPRFQLQWTWSSLVIWLYLWLFLLLVLLLLVNVWCALAVITHFGYWHWHRLYNGIILYGMYLRVLKCHSPYNQRTIHNFFNAPSIGNINVSRIVSNGLARMSTEMTIIKLPDIGRWRIVKRTGTTIQYEPRVRFKSTHHVINAIHIYPMWKSPADCYSTIFGHNTTSKLTIWEKTAEKQLQIV